MEIVLATRNSKKLEEIKRITAGLPITVLSLNDFPGCPEVVEDQDTFEGNARKKALEVCRYTGKPSLADDSGLEVEALGGAPGVFSARYAGASGNGSDAKNNDKLLAELSIVPDEKRGARFVCCIALAFPHGTIKTFLGMVQGHIGRELKGACGFGYDPFFIPEGQAKTFGELTGPEKDLLSHRGKALRNLAEFLRASLD